MKLLSTALLGALVLSLAPVAAAQGAPYTAQILGPGTLVNDMNLSGEVVGWTISGGLVQGYVAGPSHPFELLPLPAGYQSAWAQGINDAGVVVGSAAVGGFPEFGQAVAWTPDGLGGWTTQLLGQLPGHTQSVAYDVNNRGDIVGSSITPGFQGGPTVWFNSPTGVLNVSALGGPGSPKEVNDLGVVVGINGPLFDLDTLQPIPLPPFPPTGWTGFQGWAIANDGSLAGTGRHGSQLSAAMWTVEDGWQSISPIFGQSASVQAFDVNASGLASAEIPQPAIHDPATGTTLLLSSVLVPAQLGNWSFSLSLGSAVNEIGQIATIGLDGSTGAVGVALLTPAAGSSTCQPGIGFDGPGNAWLAVCGGDLSPGTTADLRLEAAAPGQPQWLLVGAFSNPTPWMGGTLVPLPLLTLVPGLTDSLGQYELPGLQGLSFPITLYFQSVALDASLPAGIGISNAVQATFGP